MRRVVLALVAVVSSLGLGDLDARADTIDDKRAEAQRIGRQLEEQARKVSILAEEFNLAVLESERVAAELDKAESRLRATDAETKVLRARLKAQAVDSYVRGGAVPALSMLVETSLEDDIAVRKEYVETVTSQVGDTLDALRAAKLTLQEQRERLTRSRDAADAAVADVEAKRADAAAAQEAHKRMLARVQGELAELVAAEERRRAAEEARRVQAELAARSAREEAAAREAAARRAAATTTTAAPRANAAVSTTTTRPSTTTTTAPPPAGGTPDPSAPPPTAGAAAAIEEAKRQLGKPYEYGGSGPDTFDCSGLTSWAWRAGGVSLPHSSQAQYSATSRVAFAEILPGDLLFYGDPIHHVALYVGDGQMIEAPETGKNVRYASIFRRDYTGAGRVN